jgi:high-affinity iron transporter
VRQHRHIVVTASTAVTTMLSALILSAVMPSAPAAAQVGKHVRGQRISVTATTCAPRWHAPNAGRAHFAIANYSVAPATIYLFHPISGRIVAQVKHVKPGTVRGLVVRLRRGERYIWGCKLKGRPTHVSEVETVPLDPNHGGPGPVVVPVTRDQLVAPMRAYRKYVAKLLALLKTQTTTLASDLAVPDTAAAESAWLIAHQTWLRIGQDDGAYGAFGELGRKIDGTAAGLVHGTSDPAFTGFHKIEFDLWTKADPAAAAADTTVLAAALARLSKRGMAAWFPYSTASVSGLPLRCHEILEDALRDSLSGDDDYGSGTGLASVRADVAGTRELLDLLAPLITARSAHRVAHARKALTKLVAAVEASKSHGKWVAITVLGRTKREHVDAAIGNALEILAPVPDLLTIGKS